MSKLRSNGDNFKVLNRLIRNFSCCLGIEIVEEGRENKGNINIIKKKSKHLVANPFLTVYWNHRKSFAGNIRRIRLPSALQVVHHWGALLLHSGSYSRTPQASVSASLVSSFLHIRVSVRGKICLLRGFSGKRNLTPLKCLIWQVGYKKQTNKRVCCSRAVNSLTSLGCLDEPSRAKDQKHVKDKRKNPHSKKLHSGLFFNDKMFINFSNEVGKRKIKVNVEWQQLLLDCLSLSYSH